MGNSKKTNDKMGNSKKTNDKIVRESVWIDPKIYPPQLPSDYNYHVEYILFKADKLPLRIPKDLTKKYPHKAFVKSQVCFSGLLGALNNTKKFNKLYVKIELTNVHNILTAALLRRWIQLAKQYLNFPSHIPNNVFKPIKDPNTKELKKRIAEVVFDINDSLSPSQLYVHLSVLRYPREIKHFVQTMLYLVDKRNMNFYIAFVLASRVCVNNTGHHILKLARGYYDPYRTKNPNRLPPIDICVAISLALYMRDPKKYDSRDIYKANSFRCAETIESIYKRADYKLNINEVYDPVILKIIEELGTPAQITKALKEFDKQKVHITYKEKTKHAKKDYFSVGK